jgi:L-iditol 2-dehydrogenase
MKAVYCTAPFTLELRTDEVKPELEAADDVIIQTAYCGICPWDVRVYNGKKSVPLPRILGHEATGKVVAVGKGVKDLEVGTRVVADFILKCGTCSMCRAGRSNKCLQPTYLKGGFQEFVKIPRKNVFPLKEGTSLKAAALTEPLACVIRGQKMIEPAPGKFEIIVGAGPIGLLHMQTAAAYGARTIVIDILDERLETAKKMGAHFVINSATEDQAAKVKEYTDGHGADAAVVTVPITPVVKGCIELMANGGKLNIFAGIYPKDELVIDPNIIHYNEISLLGSADSTHEDFVDALSLIESGQILTELLISDLFPLEQLDDGFKRVNSRGGLKIVVETGGEV